MARNKVIVRGGEGGKRNFIVGAQVYPGELVEIYNDSGTLKIKPHSGAEQPAVKAFVLEDRNEGRTVDDAIAVGELAEVYFALPGDAIQARISNGQDVTIGNKVESAGDGRLQAFTADTWASADTGTIYPQVIVGQAEATVTMSGSSGEDPDGFCIITIW